MHADRAGASQRCGGNHHGCGISGQRTSQRNNPAVDALHRARDCAACGIGCSVFIQANSDNGAVVVAREHHGFAMPDLDFFREILLKPLLKLRHFLSPPRAG